MKKLFFILISVFLYANTYYDCLNRAVSVKQIKRIIAIGPGALRMVVYLKAQNEVVGIEKFEQKHIHTAPYILANKNLLKLPKIGMGGPSININLEKIVSLKPDLIIAGFITKQKAEEIENKTHIPVFVIRYGVLGNFDKKEFLNALNKLSKILNKQKRAEKLSKYLINLKIPHIKTDKKVYIGAVAYKGLHGLTSTIGNFPPFKLTGIKNLINSKSQVFINAEYLYKINPDVIFIDESGLKLIDFNKYKYLKAFKTGNVYGLLPYNSYMSNVEVALLDAFYVAKVFGADVNIEQKAKELFEIFVGKNVYPQMKKYFGGLKKLRITDSN